MTPTANLLQSPPPPSLSLPARILLVDDESGIREMLYRSLLRPGLEIETAANGEAALEQIAHSRFDLVITDLRMPGGMDGQELFRRIKGMPEGPDVMLISGVPDLSSTLEAFRYGAWDYMVKPINIQMLRESVERCLRHRRSSEIDDPKKLRETLLAAHRELNSVNGMRGVLGRYIDKNVLDTILGAKTPAHLQGVQQNVSVLFVDIRDFTAFSQSRSPDVVVAVLNSLLTRLATVVSRNNGVIDKYTGDGMMIVFGAPQKLEDHATRAAKCALEMMKETRSWNDERIRRGLSALEIGIGINSGAAVAGSVGSPERSDFTVIGSTVNMAARLEHQAGPGEILIGPATTAEISLEYDVLSKGMIKMKGFRDAVSVFCLLCTKDDRPS